MKLTAKSGVRTPAPGDADMALAAHLLAACLLVSSTAAAQPRPFNLTLQTSNRATPFRHSLALPSSTTQAHRDDLSIELCRQGTRARLRMEEAVKGLHGTGRHQLERTHRLSGDCKAHSCPGVLNLLLQPVGWGETWDP